MKEHSYQFYRLAAAKNTQEILWMLMQGIADYELPFF